MAITDGDGLVFGDSGFYLFVPADAGNGYQIFNPDGSITTGAYSSYSAAGATATAAITASDYPGLPINATFHFATPLSGANSISANYSGYFAYQDGDFLMFANPVPSSIAGQSYHINVQDGGGLFASRGEFVITTASSGSAYTITALSEGGANSSGTYTYSRPNATCGRLQLIDSLSGSSTVYLGLTNSDSGGYYLASANGYQGGYLTRLNSQAPASIAGSTLIAAVSSGTLPFADSGYFLFLLANLGNGYQVVGLGNVASSTGTYSYSHSGATGTINLSDSVNGPIQGGFVYFTRFLGAYSLSAGTSGQYTQTGDFALVTNPVPNSLTGQGFYITVTNGTYPFAADGSFTFSAMPSGNGYILTPISGGVLGSIGTYSYSKLNASCGSIELNDSVAGVSTAYVAFSNSVSGAFVLTQPSSGGYQVGLVTALNTRISITSPTTATNYTTTSGTLNLAGTASDTLGIARVVWKNDRGGNAVANGTSAWSADGITLQSGTNVITVTAHDTVSNTAQAVLTVIHNPPDTTPPTIAITSPTTAPIYTNYSSAINLSGTSGDNIGVTQVSWSNNQGGNGLATGITSWSITGVALQIGTNIITVFAYDAVGNVDQKDITILFTLPRISFQTSGTKLVLLWPTNASDFTLQASSALSPTSMWTSAFLPYAMGNNYVVTNSTTNGAMFFRLKK